MLLKVTVCSSDVLIFRSFPKGDSESATEGYIMKFREGILDFRSSPKRDIPHTLVLLKVAFRTYIPEGDILKRPTTHDKREERKRGRKKTIERVKTIKGIC